MRTSDVAAAGTVQVPPTGHAQTFVNVGAALSGLTDAVDVPVLALQCDAPLTITEGFAAADGTTLVAHVRDVATELPPLLGAVREAGCKVLDVEVRSPSLHAVFIHLTGRDLRE